MGGYVAIPALGAVDLDQLIIHALFGDALFRDAAAGVVEAGGAPLRGPGHLRLVEVPARNGRDPTEVAAWGVHPSRPRVLDVVADRLGPPRRGADRLPVRAGRARQQLVGDNPGGPRPPHPVPTAAGGQRGVALGFDPGLTLYAALLEAIA